MKISHYLEYAVKFMFANLALKNSEDNEVVVFCSTYLYPVLKRRKAKKTINIVDHGSLHPAYESELMHNENVTYGFKNQGNSVSPFLDDMLQEEFESSDAVFVYSTLAKRTFIKHNVSEEKIFVNKMDFSGGLRDVKFTPRTFEVNNTAQLKLLYVGAVIPRKGIHRLLKALELCELSFSIKLTCVGAKASDDILCKILEKHRNKIEVVQVGIVNEPELKNFYQEADFFVLPSICDGFGMVTAQALANQCCCIVSAGAGSSELIENNVNGFILSDVRNVDVLCKELHKIFSINSSKYNYVRQRGFNTACDLYDRNSFSKTLTDNLQLVSKRVRNTR
ncbi:glycosyltransferase family 4 protein [Planktomarina temperata]|nr:glycosyltransferase family 4 protein [Planktomarina temperata]